MQQMIVIYATILCIVQFATLRYAPWEQIPTREDLQAGQQAINRISEIQGEVFIPYHGYLTTLAGKDIHASSMALIDVIGWDRGSEVSNELTAEISRAIQEKRFAAIVMDSPYLWFSEAWFPELSDYYSEEEKLFAEEDVFWPVTGMRTRPEWILYP